MAYRYYEDELAMRSMYERLKDLPVDAWENQILEKKSYMYYYHLSHLRSNLLCAISFQKEDVVLEIGGECGALTDYVARHTAEVDMVELESVKCEIAKLRLKGQTNATVYNANMRDLIAGELKEKRYSVLLMTGNLKELANEHGYGTVGELLGAIKALLKPGARVILAMDNRLGLAYFAGYAAEDQNPYAVMEGQSSLLTKEEISQEMKEAGFEIEKYSYPFPDYRFPTDIYTDDYLPTEGRMTNVGASIGVERVSTFNEALVCDDLSKRGLYPLFANSYLIECISKEN